MRNGTVLNVKLFDISLDVLLNGDLFLCSLTLFYTSLLSLSSPGVVIKVAGMSLCSTAAITEERPVRREGGENRVAESSKKILPPTVVEVHDAFLMLPLELYDIAYSSPIQFGVGPADLTVIGDIAAISTQNDCLCSKVMIDLSASGRSFTMRSCLPSVVLKVLWSVFTFWLLVT